MEMITYTESWQEPLVDLWQQCGLTRPWNDPIKDIQRKLTDTMGQLVLMVDDDKLIGSVMVGFDGHRGSVFYLAVLPDYQARGCGKQLMQYCEDYLLQLGCPKLNLCVRDTNVKVLDFYQALGYEPEPVTLMGKRLIADN